MNQKVERIYQNCREKMKNNPEDWFKAGTSFKQIWTPELDKDIQEAISKLEDEQCKIYIRKALNYLDDSDIRFTRQIYTLIRIHMERKGIHEGYGKSPQGYDL